MHSAVMPRFATETVLGTADTTRDILIKRSCTHSGRISSLCQARLRRTKRTRWRHGGSLASSSASKFCRGGFWHYEYIVAAIDDFAGINLHRNAPLTDFSVIIHRVREVYHDETQDFVFPLKAKYDADNNTLEGVTARLAPDSAAFACPPMFGSNGNDGDSGARRATVNNQDDGEPTDALMLADDIAQQMLGDAADILDDDGNEGDTLDDDGNEGDTHDDGGNEGHTHDNGGNEGDTHDNGGHDGHKPPPQQLPEPAPTKPQPKPITLYGANLRRP